MQNMHRGITGHLEVLRSVQALEDECDEPANSFLLIETEQSGAILMEF